MTTTANLNLFLDYTTFISRMREVVSGAVIIQALHSTALEEWARSTDLDSGNHLIQGIFTSPQKSDAIRAYIARLMKVHMISLGGHLTAWTKDTVASDNATNVAISNRIAAIEFQTNEELFMLVATRLMGYDDSLIKFALAEDPIVKARGLINYLSGQFDLSVEGSLSHELYLDQALRMQELLETGGFTPEFFAGHIYQASKYFQNFEGFGVNLWDVFEALDPFVEVTDEHRVAHNVDQGLVLDHGTLVQPMELEFTKQNVERIPHVEPKLAAEAEGQTPMSLDFNDGIAVKE